MKCTLWDRQGVLLCWLLCVLHSSMGCSSVPSHALPHATALSHAFLGACIVSAILGKAAESVISH